MENNYSIITELPGYKASEEQFQRFCNRYYFASQFCNNKEILEVACGSGQGLGHLAKKATKVVGGDVDENVLKYAQKQYKDRKNIELTLFDAHKIPFNDNSFDVVIIFEAIYYLKNFKKFLEETKRVLRKNGLLIISTANKSWSDFNKSAFSYKYYTVPELFDILKENDFKDINFFGDSPVSEKGIKDKIISLIKKTAVKLNLIPKSMKGKSFFKRIFLGKLINLPNEITENMIEYIPPKPISSEKICKNYKIIFVTART